MNSRLYVVKMGGCGIDTFENMTKYLWWVFDTKDLVRYEVKCTFAKMASLSNDFNGVLSLKENEAKEKGFFNYTFIEKSFV